MPLREVIMPVRKGSYRPRSALPFTTSRRAIRITCVAFLAASVPYAIAADTSGRPPDTYPAPVNGPTNCTPSAVPELGIDARTDTQRVEPDEVVPEGSRIYLTAHAR